MIEIKIKCETPEEAAMYLEAPRVRGALDSFAYWLRNQIKNPQPSDDDVRALWLNRIETLEEVREEFYEHLGEML